MKPVVIVGIVLIILGIVSLAYQGITYSSEEEVVDIGPIQATAETRKSIPLPPLVGGIAIASGTLLIVVGLKRA